MAVLCLSFSALGQATYTSLADGNWNNTSVWSLDGSTPCSCAPPATVTGFTVVAEHNVIPTANLTVGSAGILAVNSGASLITNFPRNLTVNSGGLVNSNGEIKMAQININAGGTANFYGPVTAGSKFTIYGNVSFGSTVTMTTGNLDIKSAATVVIASNVIIDIIAGNAINAGTIDFQGGCITINGGNFTNQPMSQVVGSGFIKSSLGNFTNNGLWDTDVDWCAPSGGGSGMPEPQDCSDHCVILPVELVSFDATCDKNSVRLDWVTAIETDVSRFIIQRCIDDDCRSEIGQVEANNCLCKSSYSMIDENPLPGKSLYRLVEVAYDGSSRVIAQAPAAIEVQNVTMRVCNGCNDQATATFVTNCQGTLYLHVTDLTGRELYRSTIAVEENRAVTITPDTERLSGIVLMAWTFGEERGTEKLVLK